VRAAQAETASPTAPADTEAEARDAASLNTIVVTAQRRSEDLEDVAIAVSAFDGGALRDAGVTNALDLQTVVASLTYVATGYAAQPYLRGVGTRLSQIGMEPSIATYVDDRYVTRPFAAMFDMFDVERVEVLKGPQGTLYGRNAAGGAIRAITKDPGSEGSVELAGKAGDYHHLALNVLAGGPLSHALRGQVSASVEKRDGFAANLVPNGRATSDDLDRKALRLKLLWDLGDRVAAKLAVSSWQYTDWTGRDFVAAGVPEANRGAALYGGVTSRDREHFASAIGGDNDLRETAADLRFDVHLEGLDLVSISTYTDASFVQSIDVDASSATLLDLYGREPSTAWSQEFQLLSAGDSKLKWIAGAFYYREDGTNVYVFKDSVSPVPPFVLGTDVSNGLQHVETEAYAVFAQGSYAFNQRWSVTLGERWSRESKAASLDAVPGTFTNVATPYSDARAWQQDTPRAAVEYRGAFGLAYASYARGFKGGGYNYPASVSPVLDPEVLDTYEIGVKSDRLGGRLRINSALYFSHLDDLQVTRGGAGAFLSTENAASAKVRGLEVDVDAAMTADFTLYAGVALTDSEYTDYMAGVLVPLYVPPYGSTPLAGGLDVRGRPLLRSPERAGYVGARYEPHLAAGGTLPITLNYAYKGDYYFDFAAVPATEWLKQAAFGVLNARIAYSSAGRKWEVGLWGSNLTDEHYYEDAVMNAASSRVSYADPRTYGVDFKLRL